MRIRWWMGLSLAAAAVVIAACGTASAPTDPGTSSRSPAAADQANAAAAGSVVIKTMSTSKGTVLVNASGRTLYWFAKDTATQSNCSSSCAALWPPVLGTATSAAGTSLPHGFGTIKRANGQTQVTYDGHPLYTYGGDTAAGQMNGNDIRASGGKWWAVTPAGTKIRRASSTSGSGGSSGGGGSGGGW